MKTGYYLYVLLLAFLGPGCRVMTEIGGGYEKEDGMIYWNFGIGGNNHQAVPLADYKSFHGMNQNYGKDKDHIFYRTTIIEDADVESFMTLDYTEYAKDKYAVYYNGKIIPGADAPTYTLYPIVGIDNTYYNVYGEDDAHVFEYDKIISDDPVHFKVINPNENIWKDSRNVHWGTSIIDSADAATFEAILFSERSQEFSRYTSYYKDRNRVFAEVKEKGVITKIIPLPGADVQTFQMVSQYFNQPEYAKDAKQVYYEAMIVEGADSNTFMLMEDGKARDKNTVYRSGKKVNE